MYVFQQKLEEERASPGEAYVFHQKREEDRRDPAARVRFPPKRRKRTGRRPHGICVPTRVAKDLERKPQLSVSARPIRV
jgi:hypothetical protein